MEQIRYNLINRICRLEGALHSPMEISMIAAGRKHDSTPGPPRVWLLIEITHWDWFVYVGLSPTSIPVEYRIQGGLNYSRQVVIEGRIRGPGSYRARPINIRLNTFGVDADFGPHGRKQVGVFHRNRLGPSGPELEADLDLPEAALNQALVALSSVWNYVYIWMDEGRDEAAISAFSFSAHIDPNNADLAGPEFEADNQQPT